MPRVEFDLETNIAPEKIRAALLDFTPRRPELWPGLNPADYEVYAVGDTWAEIREGSGGRVWARERYDWSMPGRIEWTVLESGFSMPGSHVIAGLEPNGAGGTRLHVTWERWGKGLAGRLVVGLIVLTRGFLVRRSIEAGLKRIAAQGG